MPRIAARTEPYEHPARQQRHFKTKRDQALKALDKAAYISRSHFAILFVNARGQAESYGTELFSTKLQEWFNERVIADAVELVANDAKTRKPGDSLSERRESRTPSPEPFDDSRIFSSPACLTAFSSPQHRPSTALDLPPDAIPFLRLDGVADGYYANVIQRIQQAAVKLIAKCWIRIIEPKKQSRHPYQKGDESKPDWWPADVRHKEPDHLLAPERQALLLSIIRGEMYPVEELEVKTFQTLRDVPDEKLELLKELFQVAKEDERRRMKAREDHSTTSAPLPKRHTSISAPCLTDAMLARRKEVQKTPQREHIPRSHSLIAPSTPSQRITPDNASFLGSPYRSPAKTSDEEQLGGLTPARSKRRFPSVEVPSSPVKRHGGLVFPSPRRAGYSLPDGIFGIPGTETSPFPPSEYRDPPGVFNAINYATRLSPLRGALPTLDVQSCPQETTAFPIPVELATPNQHNGEYCTTSHTYPSIITRAQYLIELDSSPEYRWNDNESPVQSWRRDVQCGGSIFGPTPPTFVGSALSFDSDGSTTVFQADASGSLGSSLKIPKFDAPPSTTASSVSSIGLETCALQPAAEIIDRVAGHHTPAGTGEKVSWVRWEGNLAGLGGADAGSSGITSYTL